MKRSYASRETANDTAGLRNALERRVVEHQLALTAVREADRDDAARLDLGDDALTERAVHDRVTRRELGMMRPRRDSGRCAVVRPRRRPQRLPLDTLPLRQLVEEPRGQVVPPRAPERARRRVRQRQPLLRTGHAHVAEPPLLLEHRLLERARVREDALLH